MVRTMLLLLLIFTVLLMAVSMAMSIAKAQSEQKTMSGNLWIALSCLSILLMMGISYLMLTAPTPTGEETALAQSTSAQAANLQKTAASEVKSADAQTSGSTAADAEAGAGSTDQQAAETLGSYDYLIEVLEAIKRGEPIPDKYLQMLSDSARRDISEHLQTAPRSDAEAVNRDTAAVGAGPSIHQSELATKPASVPPAYSNRPAANTNSAGSTKPQGNNTNSPGASLKPPGNSTNTNRPTTGSSNPPTSGVSNPPVTSPNTNSPAASPKPADTAKPSLTATSWLRQTLQHDRNSVHDTFKYALQLEQSSDKEVYLTGDMVAEVHYSNNTATSIVLVMERLVPEGQSRDYWEAQFRQKAGMDSSPATSRSGMVSSWQNVYAGVSSIQFIIDLDNNRGLIQAH